MYCPACGAESTQGLNYCKRCGVNLAAPAGNSGFAVKPPKVAGMFWAVAAFGMGSIFALVGGMIALVALNAREEAIIGLAVLGSAAIIIIATLLIRLISRYMSAYREVVELPQPKSVNTAPQHPQIDAPPRAVSSVTENTTRNFDPVSIDDWSARDRSR